MPGTLQQAKVNTNRDFLATELDRKQNFLMNKMCKQYVYNLYKPIS